MESQKPTLNYLNFLNGLGLVGNLAVSYTRNDGSYGDSYSEMIEDVSTNFQTIISPAAWAFSIWGLIYLSQAIFVVAQFLPVYRSNALVQKGVNIWYFLACVFQTIWGIAFSSYRNILASLVLIWLEWLSLLGLFISQYRLKADSSLFEHVILKLPFNILFAWITAASFLNTGQFVIKMDGSIAVQLAFGLGTLAILHGLAIFMLFGLSKPNYTVPAVFVWAIAAISWELKNPEFSIVERFDSDTITGIQYTAIAVAFIIAFHMLTRLALCFANKVRNDKTGITKASSDEVKTLELAQALSDENDTIQEHGNEP